MKISKKLVSFVLMLVAVVTFSFTAVTLTKAKAETAFVMDDKAVIRVIAPESEGKNTYGIGFRAKVTEPVDGAYYNMMIIPENYVEAYETAVETKDETRDIVTFMLDKKADADAADKNMPLAIATNLKVDQDGYITGGLVNIKYENLNVNFYGFGYYELGDDVVNATPATVEDAPTYSRRSIAEVASNAILSGDYDNATGDTLEELKDIQNIYMQSLKQNSGVEEDDAAATAPNLTLNYSNAKTYIRGSVDLNSSNGVADGLINWSSSADSVATVDADGVIVGKSAGTATITAKLFNQVTATCEITVDPVEVANADNVSVNVESATKGSVTLTSKDGASYGNNSSFIAIHGDYSNEFIKVGFKTPSVLSKPEGYVGDWSVFMGNQLGVGARNASINYNNWNAALSAFTMQPSPYGGGMKLNVNGQNLYVTDGNDDMFTISGSYFSISPDTNYYYVYGIVDNPNGSCVSNENKDYGFYFALLNSDGEVMRSFYSSKSHAEEKDIEINKDHGTDIYYYRANLNDVGAFMINTALANQSRTLTYEVLSKESGLAIMTSGVGAPTVSQADGKVSWNAIAWADGYKYRVDAGEWQETAETSFELGVGVHTVEVKAFNNDIESAVASIDYLYVEDDIVIKNAKDISFTDLTYESGTITYTNSKAVDSKSRADATSITIKKEFADEMIKVKFDTLGSNFSNNKLAISLRQEEEKDDYLFTWVLQPEASNGLWLTTYVGTQQYYPLTSGFGGVHLWGGNQYFGGNLSYTTMFTGDTYYIVAGFVGKGDDATLFVGFLDENENLIKLNSLSWSAIKAFHDKTFSSHALPSLADAGWFTIWDTNYGGTRTLEYEVISNTAIMNAVNRSMTNNPETNTVTATITSNENASYTNATSIVPLGIYKDEFIKVGFTAVDGTMQDQKIAIGVRRQILALGANAGTGAQFAFYTNRTGGLMLWSNNAEASANKGAILNQTIDLTTATFTAGDKYYIYAGAIGEKTDAEDTVVYYFALYKDVNGEEILQNAQKIIHANVVGTQYWGGGQNYGCFEIFHYAPNSEKTFTYQIVDSAPIIAAIDPAE